MPQTKALRARPSTIDQHHRHCAAAAGVLGDHVCEAARSGVASEGHRPRGGGVTDQATPGAHRAAIYARVSSADGRQTTANQVPELQRLAAARGFDAAVYEEQESAAKARPVLEQMLAEARAGRIQAVVVWALDRVHRSMVGAITTVLELDRLGVQVISLKEPWLDTSGPVRSLLVAIFGWVAEQERTRLIERTKAGLERARAQGKRLGRPPCSPVLLGAAADHVAEGMSIRAAAKAAGVPERSLRRHLLRQAAT